MAVTKASNSSLVSTNNKYVSLLAGNAAFIPNNFYSIATVTAAGGETSLTFSSIPSTYTHLQIRLISRQSSASVATGSIKLTFNGDNANNYPYHYLQGNGTSAVATGSSANAWIYLTDASQQNNATAGMFAAAIVDIIDYANTSKYKTTKYIAGGDANTATTNESMSVGSGVWMSTSAINSITLSVTGAVTYIAGSTFALYGVK